MRLKSPQLNGLLLNISRIIKIEIMYNFEINNTLNTADSMVTEIRRMKNCLGCQMKVNPEHFITKVMINDSLFMKSRIFSIDEMQFHFHRTFPF